MNEKLCCSPFTVRVSHLFGKFVINIDSLQMIIFSEFPSVLMFARGELQAATNHISDSFQNWNQQIQLISNRSGRQSFQMIIN
jgi:hypothetical protein